MSQFIHDDKMLDFIKDRTKLIQELEEPINIQKIFAEGNNDYVFFRIDSLTYEEDFPRLEAFENVIASINKPECRLVYYLQGTKKGVSFYVGAVVDPNKKNNLNLVDYQKMLENALKGNFLGTKLTLVRNTDMHNPAREIFEDFSLNFSTVLGIPSRNKDKDDISFQGVDRLVNIMTGIDFHLMIIWEPVPMQMIDKFDRAVKDIYGNLQYIGKYSEQIGTNRGTQTGTNVSIQEGTSDSHNLGTSSSDAKTKGSRNHTDSVNEGRTQATNYNKTTGSSDNESEGESYSKTHEIHNKHASEYAKYIDEELLPRLRQGKAKGMFRTAVYLGTESLADLALLENAVTSIYQGDSSTFYPLHTRPLPKNENVRQLVGNFEIYNNIDASTGYLALYSRPLQSSKVPLATWLTPAEISIMASFPQKEIPGLELREQVVFGLNLPSLDTNKEKVYLGHMLQEGNELEKRPVYLLKDDLDKHIFVAGTTGSGKTTTCLRLLQEANMPFLVIEPAKTEYRILFNSEQFQDTILFTLGNEKGVPFRFNPFEFLPEESLSAHVDILKACFMASFDMDAAIPNLLEEALYKTYEAFGWSFRDNSNKYLKNRKDAWNCNGIYFPTISDYLRIISNVIDTKGFDQRLRDDYLGSIRARLDSLRTGVKGLMLDTRLSVDFEQLIDKKVILELEELKSGEDKSFIMGLVLGRLVEALKSKHKKNPNFKHITLVEEAHRLLSRPQHGSSPGRMLGVEMFTDMLAEVRKYGESLIIVDQIPNKLAPEVLKNTNTKIIHKLFSRDDKEAIGDAISLDEKQQAYISKLGTGEAIISSQGWHKPINVQIKKFNEVDTSDRVPEENVISLGWEYWLKHPWIFNPDIPQELCKNITIHKNMLEKIDRLSLQYNEAWGEGNLARWELWKKLLQDTQELLQENDRLFLDHILYRRYVGSCLQGKKEIKNIKEAREELKKCFDINAEREFREFFENYLIQGE